MGAGMADDQRPVRKTRTAYYEQVPRVELRDRVLHVWTVDDGGVETHHISPPNVFLSLFADIHRAVVAFQRENGGH